jgi:hypothetical protein
MSVRRRPHAAYRHSQHVLTGRDRDAVRRAEGDAPDWRGAHFAPAGAPTRQVSHPQRVGACPSRAR